jgi:hypothetical protein
VPALVVGAGPTQNSAFALGERNARFRDSLLRTGQWRDMQVCAAGLASPYLSFSSVCRPAVRVG